MICPPQKVALPSRRTDPDNPFLSFDAGAGKLGLYRARANFGLRSNVLAGR